MERQSPLSDAVLRLAAGVEIVPVDDLPAEIQQRLDRDWGRFALIRNQYRTIPLLLDEEMAALVEEFRQPSSIPEAMIRLGARHQRDPRELLKESFSFLRRLRAQRFLIDAEIADNEHIGPALLDSGDWLEDLEVVRTVQRLEDMEVHQVRLADGRFGALKIAGIDSADANARVVHEAQILRHLAGVPSPELLRAGEVEGRGYLLLEWQQGSDVLLVSGEWRRRGDAEAKGRPLENCCRILETYRNLHRRGVIHGDVNARNTVIDCREKVRLLDFEDAVFQAPASGGDPPRGRAGVSIYFEPEYARAILAGEPSPPASEAGEQYALAVLVYELLAGVPYLDFDLRWEVLLKQIVEQPPLSFAAHGLPSWPAVEEVLKRALSKEPDRRFPSVAAMAAALTQAEPRGAARHRQSPRRGSQLDELIRRTSENAAIDGPWMAGKRESALSSVVYDGAAGVALALYRMSRQLEEATLLELADVWIRRAAGAVDTTAEEKTAAASPFVGVAGVHLVEARIAAALDQPERRNRALLRSLHSVNEGIRGVDLYDGRASRLLALGALLEECGSESLADRDELLDLGGQTLDGLWSDLQRWPVIADTVGDLGMAHGWAGFLYAALRWCRSAGEPVPADLERRLHELADQAAPIGRGLMWPWRLPLADRREPRFTAGWCNGSAGYVFLWTMAVRVLDEESFLALAEGAAWNCWESAQRDGTLCCGLVGRAYALLDLYRATGERLWLDRARDLAELTFREGEFDDSRPEGLFQGRLGLALLAADLQRPDRAWFPFVAPEDDRRGGQPKKGVARGP